MKNFFIFELFLGRVVIIARLDNLLISFLIISFHELLAFVGHGDNFNCSAQNLIFFN